MRRTDGLTLAVSILALAACGGGDDEGATPATASASETTAQPEASAPAASVALPEMGEPTRPDWFVVDESARAVHISLTAGATPVKNYWNYNGHHDGNVAVTVPEGYTVTVDLINEDPAMPHSVGVSEVNVRTSAAPAPEPVIAGAITPDATSMTNGTMPGETETITFTAEEAHTYALLCYVPGHAATGMWIYLMVTPDDTPAGVREVL